MKAACQTGFSKRERVAADDNEKRSQWTNGPRGADEKTLELGLVFSSLNSLSFRLLLLVEPSTPSYAWNTFLISHIGPHRHFALYRFRHWSDIGRPRETSRINDKGRIRKS